MPTLHVEDFVNRIKKIGLGLAASALVAYYTPRVIAAIRLSRLVRDLLRGAGRASTTPTLLSYREVQRKMTQGLHRSAPGLNMDFLTNLHKHPRLAFAGQAYVPQDLPETQRLMAKAIGEVSKAELAQIARVLGHDTVEEAVHSAAYDAVSGGRLKPTTPPPFPDGSDKAKPSDPQD